MDMTSRFGIVKKMKILHPVSVTCWSSRASGDTASTVTKWPGCLSFPPSVKLSKLAGRQSLCCRGGPLVIAGISGSQSGI